MSSRSTAHPIRPIYLLVPLLIVAAYVSLAWFQRAIIIREAVQPSDAIIVLLGDTDGDRTALAEELYRRGIAPRIVFGAAYESLAWLSTFQFGYVTIDGGTRYRRTLLSRGVPETALTLVHAGSIYDTSSELTAISEFVRMQGWRTVVLATSASHSRRCRLIWDRVAPDIRARVVGAPDPELEERGFWRSRHARVVVTYEFGSYIKENIRRLFAPTIASAGEKPSSNEERK